MNEFNNEQLKFYRQKLLTEDKNHSLTNGYI